VTTIAISARIHRCTNFCITSAFQLSAGRRFAHRRFRTDS